MTKDIFILITGVLLTFGAAMTGLTLLPKHYMEPNMKLDYSEVPKEILLGHNVYAKEGCIYCHTQQVRAKGFGVDFERGWGRASLANDYLPHPPHPLGTMRTGPDLTTIGSRQPSEVWHFIHLYQPRAVVKESIMPPYPWLFDVVDASVNDPQALALPKEYEIPGKKVVPNKEGKALVAYLLYLKQPELKGGK